MSAHAVLAENFEFSIDDDDDESKEMIEDLRKGPKSNTNAA